MQFLKIILRGPNHLLISEREGGLGKEREIQAVSGKRGHYSYSLDRDLDPGKEGRERSHFHFRFLTIKTSQWNMIDTAIRWLNRVEMNTDQRARLWANLLTSLALSLLQPSPSLKCSGKEVGQVQIEIDSSVQTREGRGQSATRQEAIWRNLLPSPNKEGKSKDQLKAFWLQTNFWAKASPLLSKSLDRSLKSTSSTISPILQSSHILNQQGNRLIQMISWTSLFRSSRSKTIAFWTIQWTQTTRQWCFKHSSQMNLKT